MSSSVDLITEKEATWNVERIRADFPVLHQTVNGKPLVYLDNGASSQVPQVVIDRGSKYLEQEHSNIHRGVHYLSQRATTAYEGAREKVKRFINARESRECIFVRGATEGVNLIMCNSRKACRCQVRYHRDPDHGRHSYQLLPCTVQRTGS